MKKTLLAFLTISLCYIAIAQTTVNTDISSSTTWNLAGSPYTITNNIDVDPGATLTIQEDVIVQFNSAVKMTVLGTLEADGATFTSASGTPSAGAWNTIEVGSTTTPGTVTLNNSQIIYAISGLDIRNGNITASNTDFTSISTNGIRASSSSAGTAVDLTVSNADFNAVGNYGLFIENTSTGTMTASATDVTINTAQFYGAFLRGNPTLTLTNSSISNTQYPVGMDTDYSVGAPDVTYSGTTSFTNNEFNGVRVNDSRMVTGDLQLRNPGYPYLMIFGFTVPESSTLSIDPGNILKFQTNSALIIEGKLLADGDLNEAIYFTSLKDDNVGGDSNNDGSTTAPAPRDWTGIFFDPDSDPTSIL
ncbi:MAG: hypothetical protein HRT61_11665, partial [Ekhidna sp.]|nr:hypothetical protein [Ekhidna sp.]